MKRYLTITIAAALCAVSLSLTSCEKGQGLTPGQVKTAAAVGTGVTLQYAVPAGRKASVASNIVKASTLYEKFSNGAVPSPDQFGLALHDYLPNNETKALTEITLTQLYSDYYQYFKDREPTVQLQYATALLLGARAGASPFVGP